MPKDTREGSKNGGRSDEEADLSARLQSLGQRLARGFRLSTELVGGVAVGAFIGWALDRWLGISPWGMILFLLLGFAAGVINVMRAAGVSGRPGQQPK